MGAEQEVSLALEYMERACLQTVLRRSPESLTKELRLKLALDCAKGIEYLHAKHVIHRDIKPGNLLVSPCSQCSL